MSTTTAAQPWRALWYLYSHSWLNRLRTQLRRLRQPRYFIGALAVVAYAASLLLRPAPDVSMASTFNLLDTRHLLTIASIAMLLGAWWIAAPSDNALAFSPAEVHLLFPAPVKRRTLVQARLFSVQAVLLIQVLIWTLVLRRGEGDLAAPLRAVGLWILFTTVSLHRLGATLSRIHAPDAPRRRPVARSIAIAYLAALVLLVAFAADHALATWRTASGTGGGGAAQVFSRVIAGRMAIQTILDAPAIHALLWPIRAVSTPAFAASATVWLQSLPAALAVLVLHYVWILRDPQPFEELAIGSSARFAERVARMRRGATSTRPLNVRLGWTLALRGNPAVALVWKNTTAVMRTFRPRPLIITILVVLVIIVFTDRSGAADAGTGAFGSAFTTTFLSIFFGALLTAPAWFRLDLRHDLAHLAFIKTAPLPAHTIIATEILTAAAIVTLGMAALFGPPAYLVLRNLGGPLGPGGLLLTLVGCTVALGGVNLLHVTLYNAVALWLPAWVPLNQGGANTGGASVVGQVYITLIGIITTLGLLLALPTLAGVGLGKLLLPHLSLALTATLGLLVALSIVVLEWLGLARLLGRALDRLEPSDIPSVQS